MEPILHTGKETTASHDHTKTQHQQTVDWTKNILIFSTSKLTKTISPTVWLKLKVYLKKKRGIGNLMHFDRRAFLHKSILCLWGDSSYNILSWAWQKYLSSLDCTVKHENVLQIHFGTSVNIIVHADTIIK